MDGPCRPYNTPAANSAQTAKAASNASRPAANTAFRQPPRRISMREAAKLQSFPDGFIFESGQWQIERQVGNAMPPIFAWRTAISTPACLLELLSRAVGKRHLGDFIQCVQVLACHPVAPITF